jgi:hypothetical protein
MLINECIREKSEVTELKVVGNKLIAFSTKLHGLKFFSLIESKIILNLESEYLNPQTTAIAFSADSRLVALANSDFIYIIDLSSKELIKKIPINSEDVEILAFDLSSIYVIAGTKSGRVLQYKYNETSLISRLYSFPSKITIEETQNKKNFVSAFAFYKNRLACSGQGGSIIVIDLHSLSNKEVLTHDTRRTDALCFVNKGTIVSGNIDGIIHIRSLENKDFHKRISMPFIRIKQIILMPNPQFIMVSGDSNALALVDIKSYKIARTKYIEFENKVEKITLADDNTLVVALSNMKILYISLPSLEDLKSLILHNSLDKAFEIIEKNPMLKNSPQHEELEKKFDKVYFDAIEALIAQNKERALQITNMFKNIASLKEKIALLFEAFRHYERFQIHCSEQKLTLAYTMANKFPALKHTLQYAEMEETWKKAFKNAQKQVLQGKKDTARQYLNAYLTVNSKKELIQLILKNNSEFIQFLKAIENQNFAVVDELASKHPLFIEMPTYIALQEEINSNLKKAQKYVERGKIKRANIYLQKIKDVPALKKEFLHLAAKCDNIMHINKLYEENDFIACYEMIDTHSYLASTEFGLLLEKHWSKTIHKCEEAALKGNIIEIKSSLGELIQLSTRRDKIGNLLRLSFHTRIKMLIVQKTFKQAETIIYSYMDIFGFDQEISAIMKTFEDKSSIKLAIEYTENYQPTRDAWVNSDIVIWKAPSSD